MSDYIQRCACICVCVCFCFVFVKYYKYFCCFVSVEQKVKAFFFVLSVSCLRKIIFPQQFHIERFGLYIFSDWGFFFGLAYFGNLFIFVCGRLLSLHSGAHLKRKLYRIVRQQLKLLFSYSRNNLNLYIKY